MATKVGEIQAIGPGKVSFKVRENPSASTATFTTAAGPTPPCAPIPAADTVTISVAPTGPAFRQRFLVTLEWAVNGPTPRTISYSLTF